jgi:hypothetical protein
MGIQSLRLRRFSLEASFDLLALPSAYAVPVVFHHTPCSPFDPTQLGQMRHSVDDAHHSRISAVCAKKLSDLPDIISNTVQRLIRIGTAKLPACVKTLAKVDQLKRVLLIFSAEAVLGFTRYLDLPIGSQVKFDLAARLSGSAASKEPAQDTHPSSPLCSFAMTGEFTHAPINLYAPVPELQVARIERSEIRGRRCSLDIKPRFSLRSTRATSRASLRAKRSNPVRRRRAGLLRRFAPRNDDGLNQLNVIVL